MTVNEQYTHQVPRQRPDPAQGQALQPNIVAGGTLGSFSVQFWLLLAGTGVGAGIGAGLLMRLLRLVQHTAWHYTQGNFLQGVEHAGTLQRILILLFAGGVAAIFDYLFSFGPGGHAGEASVAIWFHDGRLPFFRTVLRGALSICLVGLGASLGREAAPKQTGGAIASLLSHWRGLPAPECRLLVACGTAAGMAAVYNVPLGGALFGVEVLLGSLKLPLLPPMLVCSLLATWVSHLWLPDHAVYQVPLITRLAPSDVVWAAIAGPIAGLVSVLYIRAISWADSRKPKGRALLLSPVVVFLLLGCLAVPFPQLLGNGKDAVQLAFFGRISFGVLLALVVLKPLATCACLGSGAPGGLFTPTMTLGALLGGVLGRGWMLLWPHAPAGTYAIIGAGAVLAAATQGPISALVLTVELTRHLDLVIIPLMLAIAGAVVTARALEPRSIYSGRIRAGRAAAGVAADTISAAASYAEVLRHYVGLADPGRPLVVLDEHGQVTGRIFPETLKDVRRLPPLIEIATAHDLITQAANPAEALVGDAPVPGPS